jgi:hypothetical protein
LLRHRPSDETAVFMDEVDVSLNPKVGCPVLPTPGRPAAGVLPAARP